MSVRRPGVDFDGEYIAATSTGQFAHNIGEKIKRKLGKVADYVRPSVDRIRSGGSDFWKKTASDEYNRTPDKWTGQQLFEIFEKIYQEIPNDVGPEKKTEEAILDFYSFLLRQGIDELPKDFDRYFGDGIGEHIDMEYLDEVDPYTIKRGETTEGYLRRLFSFWHLEDVNNLRVAFNGSKFSNDSPAKILEREILKSVKEEDSERVSRLLQLARPTDQKHYLELIHDHEIAHLANEYSESIKAGSSEYDIPARRMLAASAKGKKILESLDRQRTLKLYEEMRKKQEEDTLEYIITRFIPALNTTKNMDALRMAWNLSTFKDDTNNIVDSDEMLRRVLVMYAEDGEVEIVLRLLLISQESELNNNTTMVKRILMEKHPELYNQIET